MSLSRNERIQGGMLGLIIGDALGVPYEFHQPEDIPDWQEIEYEPPAGYDRSYPQIKPGTWSDDSAQALCLLESLLQCQRFDLHDFADKLLRWYNQGYWSVDRYTFDSGIQTQAALLAYGSGMPAEQCGFTRPDGKGNGALMRVLPLVLFHHGQQNHREQLINDAHQQCLITHGHICNQVCCALYCLWADYLMAGIAVKLAWQQAVDDLQVYYSANGYADYRYELEQVIQEGNFSGSGFVIDSIRSAKHLLFTYQDYESVVKGAISLGHDTDTTAAIAGGLAGIHFGINQIPERFLHGLRDIERVKALLAPLLTAES